MYANYHELAPWRSALVQHIAKVYMRLLYVDSHVPHHRDTRTEHLSRGLRVAPSGSARRALWRARQQALTGFHLEPDPGAYLSSPKK